MYIAVARVGAEIVHLLGEGPLFGHLGKSVSCVYTTGVAFPVSVGNVT